MPTLIVGTLNRLLADLLVAGARRRWPLLRLVPRRWLRPLLIPTARQLRSSLACVAVFMSLAAIAVGVMLVLPGSESVT
jgi:hypothetical protein